MSFTYANPRSILKGDSLVFHQNGAQQSTNSGLNSNAKLRSEPNKITFTGTTGSNFIVLDGVANPSNDNEVANKAYVDNLVSAGISWKTSARGTGGASNLAVASSTDVLLTGSAALPASVGGVAYTAGDRILLYAQTDPEQNGVYTIDNLGTPSTPFVLRRAADCDEVNDIKGLAIFAREGADADTAFYLTTDSPITLGTTGLDFVPFSSNSLTASDGIVKTANNIAIAAGGVLTTMLADDAVTTDKIIDDAVTADKILDGAVTTLKIAPNAVTTNELATNAVLTVNINNDAVATDKIKDGAVTSAKMDTDIAITGDLQAQSLQATSDRRLKEEIVAIPAAECGDLVAQMQAYRYQFITEPERRRVGFMAQEAEEWCPESVLTNAETDKKSISYMDIVPLLCGAIQNLQQKVAQMEQQNSS